MTATARHLERRSSARNHEAVMAALDEGLQRLSFGIIAITVHDGRIVQMEITEKRRFDT